MMMIDDDHSLQCLIGICQSALRSLDLSAVSLSQFSVSQTPSSFLVSARATNFVLFIYCLYFLFV